MKIGIILNILTHINVATIDSTLPIENLSRGGRSIFIFCRPLKKN